MKNKYNKIIAVLFIFLVTISSISSVWAHPVLVVDHHNSNPAVLHAGLIVKTSWDSWRNIMKPLSDISRASLASMKQSNKIINATIVMDTIAGCVSDEGDGCRSCSSHMGCCTVSIIHDFVIFSFEAPGQCYISSYVERKPHLFLPVDFEPPRYFF